jgi:hypothetical protein
MCWNKLWLYYDSSNPIMLIEVQKGEQVCWHVLGVSIWSLFLFLALNCSHCVIVFAIILFIILLYFEDMSVIYAISAYHHWCCELDSRSGRGLIKRGAQAHIRLFVCLMVLNATFNHISAISRLSVLLVEETGGPGEIHIMLHTSSWSRVELTTSVVIGTDMQCTCVHGTTLVERDISGKSRTV